MRKGLALLGAIILSACSTGIDRLPGVNAPPVTRSNNTQSTARPALPRPADPPSGGASAARDFPGFAGVLGAQADTLSRRFGAARLDAIEGEARKLQFLGAACVLDIYLYPPFAGGEPVATHVIARSRNDGAETDAEQCLREIEARRAAGN
ncbi:MAG: hypothetical protein AAGH57_04490 [Pseudomonadota bacterium]